MTTDTTTTSQRRDGLVEVATAARHVMRRACQLRLSGRRYRVLLAVLEQTVGWTRMTDRVSHSQLAEAAAVGDVRDLRQELAALASAGLIVYAPGSSPAGGRRVSSLIGLPRPGGELTGGSDGPGVETDRGSISPQTGGSNDRRPGGGTTPPPEEVPEDLPEKDDDDAQGFASKLLERLAVPLDLGAINKAAADVLALGWESDALAEHVTSVYDAADRRQGVTSPSGFVLSVLRSKPSPPPKGARRSRDRGIGTGGVVSSLDNVSNLDRLDYHEGFITAWHGYHLEPGDSVRDDILRRAADGRSYHSLEAVDLIASIRGEDPPRPQPPPRRQDPVAARYGPNAI